MLTAIKNAFTRNDAATDEKASLRDTQDALNAVANKSGFSCVPVSWEDAQRGTVDGALSCWGGNISDVRLWAKDGTLLYTLRTQNWNERLGYVASKDVAVVVGNHVPGGATPSPVTLQRYLKNFKEYAGYAGVTSEQLFDETADQLLSIRFQAVFLPIATDETSEFCTEVYNYNTHSDDDPRNVALLCTAQGTHVQQDGEGAKKMFMHAVDPKGVVHRYWLEAERSRHKVGGAQLETEEEAAAAAARGKATAIHIGTKAMGTRFNVQMLIQLPVQQKRAPARPAVYSTSSSCVPCPPCPASVAYCSAIPTPCSAMPPPPPPTAMPPLCSAMPPPPPQCAALSAPPNAACEDADDGALGDALFWGGEGEEACAADEEEELCAELDEECDADQFCAKEMMAPPPCDSKKSALGLSKSKSKRAVAPQEKPKPKVGTANAARVSRGSEEDKWAGVKNKTPLRDPSQHGTITVTLYYTVAGGVPSPEDVEACVADLDELYKACPTDKKLVDCGEITAELTVKDCIDITKKISEQPYVPPNFAPVKSQFPQDE